MAKRTGEQVPTRQRLHMAALQQVAEDGPGASVRAITRAAGVTEGALYRHYDSREDLLGAVFTELVEPMIAEKQRLLSASTSAHDKVREWVRCTYQAFDQGPDAFAYVFLTDHRLPARFERLSRRQGELFRAFVAQQQATGAMRGDDPDLATTLFAGLLLSVPAQVRRGRMACPAMAFVDDVTGAAWRLLGPPVG